MPEDTEDTNAPDPDPPPGPAAEPHDEVIDISAQERMARMREALGETVTQTPPNQRGPSERALPERTPSEPEPIHPTIPLWLVDDAAHQRHRDAGGPPLPPIAGAHTAHSVPPTPDPPPAPSDPPTYLDGEPTTRLLCAAMHLQAAFAIHVNYALVTSAMQAIPPVWGLDPVALMRHARMSMRLWAQRDRELRIVIPVFTTAMTLLLLSFLKRWLPWQVEVLLLVGIPAACWTYAWAVIYQHYRGARSRALGVMDPRMPARDWAAVDRGGPVLSPDEQAGLEELARANVVVAGGAWPFVGDGHRVGNWTLTIDLEKGTRTKDGRRLAPGAVSPLSLHHHLLAAVPQLAPGAVQAHHRLYVRGPAASAVPGLLPGPPEQSPKPRPRIDPKTVDAFAVKPTPAARSFVVFQRVLWGGQIVASLIVRAERQRNTLFIEASEHVLPPLRQTFHDVTLLPKDSSRVRKDLLISSFHAARPQIVRAWGRWFEKRRADKDWLKGHKRAIKDFRHGMPVNHGQATSIREEVSDLGRLNHFGLAEETLAIMALRRRTFEVVEAYLDSHDIDITDVRRQISMIVVTTPVSLVNKGGSSATLGSNVS